MFLPADVCMPNNQDSPDLSETSGRFSGDQIYWIHFLKIQKFFETVMIKKKKRKTILIHTVAVYFTVLEFYQILML